jgi:RING finger/CCCH-type zinc finger protein
MQAPSWTDFLQCSVCTNRYNTTSLLPISLSCGHVICKKCLTEFMSRVCPYDKTAISPNAERLPPNSALLWLLGDGGGGEEGESCEPGDFSLLGLTPEDMELFKSSRNSIRKVAVYLQPLAEPGSSQVIHYLTRPMLKKLVTVVSCQFLEADGRARVLRATRSITDRTVTELLVMHQNQQQISTLLWSAIRSRGCQFLGPVMQEEALKLILKVLEGGAFLSRKNIVLYVVQQLQQQEFHQASKTSVGHVVQLLYRASCFNVEKRDEDSSRMQLKEEFRTYEALRREHDAQIIRVAMESGLRISPEQWSALLYGDQKHKSDMQSIIDKLLSQGIATSGLSELIVAIRRSQDQHNLLEKIVPHLEKLLHVDINIDKSGFHLQ